MKITLNFRRCKHEFHVRPNTISSIGASYLCSKCLKEDTIVWNSPIQVARANNYLAIKHALKQEK